MYQLSLITKEKRKEGELKAKEEKENEPNERKCVIDCFGWMQPTLIEASTFKRMAYFDKNVGIIRLIRLELFLQGIESVFFTNVSVQQKIY